MGLTPQEIKRLRLFNNRIKHVLRHPDDSAILKSGEKKSGQLVRNLKVAADKSILAALRVITEEP
jgi:hypothetical protein